MTKRSTQAAWTNTTQGYSSNPALRFPEQDYRATLSSLSNRRQSHVTLKPLPSVIVADGDEDNYDVRTGGFPLVIDHEGNFSEHFTAAFPATAVVIECENVLEECDVTVTVLGY